MLSALKRLIGIGTRQLQLSLELDAPPRSSEDLRRSLMRLGLAANYSLRLTQNRTVLVSFTDREVRIHRGYLEAPDEILLSVVRFVQGRTRRERADARRGLLQWKIPTHAHAPRRPRRQAERTNPADERLSSQLAKHHADLNAMKFGGELAGVPIRVSRRMKSRLGHYTWRGQAGHEPEIVISRRHIRRDGWDEAIHTLLHEMVHQWQDERGLKVDHGREFRHKARAVGITPLARRDVA
ncbi:MAG: SprT-like domain-containing protein [Gemmatimonadales bacterium]